MRRTNFYISVIIIIYSFNLPVHSQGAWENIISPSTSILTSVHFVDSLYGWAVGDSGTIIHTTNSGNDWDVQKSNTTNRLIDVFFISRNIGWAVSWDVNNFPIGTIIHKTIDAGNSWKAERYRVDEILMRCIMFLDSLNGWMGGSPHALVKTTDGGVKWTEANIDSSVLAFFPVNNIKFYNNLYGFACGGAFEIAGVIWKTTNGGDRWIALDAGDAPPDPIQQIHLFDELNVIGVGGDFEYTGVGVIRTTDGGGIWEYESVDMPGIAFDLEFRNDYEAWATRGYPGNLIFSIDTGITWQETILPINLRILDIFFADSLHGYAIGEQGTILKYIPPVVNDVTPQNELSPTTFTLHQNFPNPFNPSSRIRYTLNSKQFVVLKIFDVAGNEIATLVNDEKPAGSYEVEFSATDLTSGIYYYRMQAGSFFQAKKMILLK